jgi:hypothetical protein
MSKGSRRRPENTDKFKENFDRIFREIFEDEKKKKEKKDEES